MSALLDSLILKYGEPIARKLLGLDKQSQNPKYAISIGNMKIDPMRIIANQGIKSIMKGGSGSGIFAKGLPLIAAGLGLAYMRNPLREGSMNHNPELQGQIDYLSGMDGMIEKNQSSGLLQYGPDSVLRGKNVVSMFGNNDYAKNLQNYIDKMETKKTKGYNTIGFGPFRTKTTNFTDFQQKQLDKAKTELENLTTDKVDEFMSAPTSKQIGPTYTGMSSVGSGGNGSGSGSSKSSPSKSSPSKSSPSRSSRHGSGPGGLHSNYRRGGIASL